MRHAITIATAGAVLGFFAPQAAAAPPDWHARQALIDSLSNPSTVAGGEVMHFEQRRIEAGVMAETEAPRSYTFRWRNEGEKPLVVTQVQTTCGCAQPTFSREPVVAGNEGEIVVTYHPKGHPGSFLRRIFVYTQLSDRYPTAVLELSGEVQSGGARRADYPCVMGPLRLKRDRVPLDPTTRAVERIEWLNSGTEPLTITADARLLPDYLQLRCEPATVAPGTTADLVIRFDPTQAPERLPERLPVLLEGIETPLGERTLMIVFEENK